MYPPNNRTFINQDFSANNSSEKFVDPDEECIDFTVWNLLIGRRIELRAYKKICEIRVHLRKAYRCEIIFFQTQVIKKLTPYMEEMLVEFCNGATFICLPEAKIGERNVNYNIWKDVGIINEKDPKLCVLYTKKKVITKVSAILLLSRPITSKKRKVLTDMEAVSLISSAAKCSKETKDQVRKAICKTTAGDSKESRLKN